MLMLDRQSPRTAKTHGGLYLAEHGLSAKTDKVRAHQKHMVG